MSEEKNTTPQPEPTAASPQAYDYVSLHFDEAIGRRWFKVYYQPVIRTLSGKISQLQALSRWEDPAYGIIMPSQFLPVAADRKKLYRLDLYVLESVCRTIHNAKEPVRVSLPLSNESLALRDIHERILFCCQEYAIPHERLCIELTSNTIAKDLSAAQKHIARFRQEGFEIWLDDYGAGLPGLGSLVNLKLDGLRVDTSLLIWDNVHAAAVLRSLAGAARELGIHIVAQGVRSQQQASFIRSIGCGQMQGEYCAPAQPSKALSGSGSFGGLSIETPAETIFYNRLEAADLPLPAIAGIDFCQPDRDADDSDPRRPEIGTDWSGESEKDPEVGWVRQSAWTWEAGWSGRDSQDMPCAILMTAGNTRKFLEASISFRRIFSGLTGTAWDENGIPHDLEDGRFFDYILRLADACARTRRHTHFAFTFPKKAGWLEADFITEYLGMNACLIWISKEISYPKAVKKQSAEAADICSIFENVWRLDLSDNHWSSLFGLMEDIRILEQIPGKGASNLFASAYLPPDECEAYMDFVNPDTLEKRIALSEGNAVNGFFHMKDRDGKFPLRRISVSRYGGENEHKYLFTISRNLVGWNDAELYKLASNQRIPSDMNLNFPKQTWIIDKHAVVQALSGHQKLSFFWKDTQRRYIGANETFLSFFDAAMSDVQDQRDEQLGWYPDQKIMRKQEEHLLEKGNPIMDQTVTCTARGSRHLLIMSKVPIYECGRIIGLAGYFMDMTDAVGLAAQTLKEVETDPVTGFLNEKGFSRVLNAAEQRYKTEHADFCISAFWIRLMSKFRKTFGDEKYMQLVCRIASALREHAPADSEFYHGVGEQYIVLSPVESIADMMSIRQDLEKQLSSIHTFDGDTHVTLYFNSCAVLYSRFLDTDDMLAAAFRGMRVN